MGVALGRRRIAQPTPQALCEEFAHIFGETEATTEQEWWRILAQKEAPPAALCLSGGGIRSATFALGVLQGLQRNEKLSEFDYISTVSGGGYIGSWLSRWHAGETDETGERSARNIGDALREPPDQTRPSRHPLRRLRSFSNFLAPSLGFSLDALTFGTIFLRNLFFNLAFWIPLLLLMALFPHSVMAVIAWAGVDKDSPLPVLQIAAFGVPAIALGIWLGAAAATLAAGWQLQEQQREWLARAATVPLLFGIPWLLLFVVFYFIPVLILGWVTTLAPAYLAPITVSGGSMLALLASLAGFWSEYGGQLRHHVSSASAALGRRFLDLIAALALLVLAVGAAISVDAILTVGEPKKQALYFAQIYSNHKTAIAEMVAILLGIALLAGGLVGVNRFSLHAIYGNRLVRAYLGSGREERNTSSFNDFDPSDNLAMSELPARPFHIINMTLNLARTSADSRDWQERKGASFTASPLHCGSSLTGYVDSDMMGGTHGMTLGRAMTISGAAASPNMGYYGSSIVALLMTILNIRLGWWVPNPREVASFPSGINKGEPSFGFWYVLKEALSGTNYTSNWLYLSDGGHFENLGLYEMVRRRCRRIVVIDGGCDGEFQYGDLHNAIRKIAVDLAVPIRLPVDLPGQLAGENQTRIAVGKIEYSALGDGYPDGELTIIKPVLTGSEPPALRAYAEESREWGQTFPHHSTLDQFFNETQFESYRQLGEWSVNDLIAGPEPSDPETTQRGRVRSTPRLIDDRRPSSNTPVAPASLQGFDVVRDMLKSLSPSQAVIGAVAAAALAGGAAQLGSRTVDVGSQAVGDAASKVKELFGVPEEQTPDSITVPPVVRNPNSESDEVVIEEDDPRIDPTCDDPANSDCKLPVTDSNGGAGSTSDGTNLNGELLDEVRSLREAIGSLAERQRPAADLSILNARLEAIEGAIRAPRETPKGETLAPDLKAIRQELSGIRAQLKPAIGGTR